MKYTYSTVGTLTVPVQIEAVCDTTAQQAGCLSLIMFDIPIILCMMFHYIEPLVVYSCQGEETSYSVVIIADNRSKFTETFVGFNDRICGGHNSANGQQFFNQWLTIICLQKII